MIKYHQAQKIADQFFEEYLKRGMMVNNGPITGLGIGHRDSLPFIDQLDPNFDPTPNNIFLTVYLIEHKTKEELTALNLPLEYQGLKICYQVSGRFIAQSQTNDEAARRARAQRLRKQIQDLIDRNQS